MSVPEMGWGYRAHWVGLVGFLCDTVDPCLLSLSDVCQRPLLTSINIMPRHSWSCLYRKAGLKGTRGRRWRTIVEYVQCICMTVMP